MKLHFTPEWLRKRIESDPDLPCEAGGPPIGVYPQDCKVCGYDTWHENGECLRCRDLAENETVALAIEATMFAPHELPLPDDLHKKYLVTARAAIDAMQDFLDG